VQDYERGSLYGLEKFWAYHHYSGLPKDQDIEIDPTVRGALLGGGSGGGHMGAGERRHLGMHRPWAWHFEHMGQVWHLGHVHLGRAR
jgi:hypothetical protein